MQTVILDLSRKNIIPPVHAKQGDVGRKFKAVLTDAGMTYAIPRGAQFSVWYSGASGEGNYSAIGDTSAFAVEENVVTVELITQMLTNAGTCSACLVMHGADGSQLGLWNIVVVVEPVPGMGSEAAEQHYTALSEVAEKAVKAAETFQTDTTMTVSGRAADAASVGNMLDGKAPAGYGLGGYCKPIDSWNNALSCGWYSSKGNAPDDQAFWHGIVSVDPNTGRLIQKIWKAHGTAHGECIRYMNNSEWSAWEYTDPPMVPGVEYRTTGRRNGKVVYTKLVSLGMLPNSSEKNVVYAPAGDARPFRIEAYTNSSWVIPFSDDYGSVSASANLSHIRIKTTGNYSAVTATAAVWYTKE